MSVKSLEKSPTFKKRFNRRGACWVYSDSATQTANLESWSFFGFQLAEFDNYLLGSGWNTNRAKAIRTSLVKRRGYLLEAWEERRRALAAQNESAAEGYILAAEGWANFLTAAKQLHEQGGELLPLARIGVSSKRAHSESASAPRKVLPPKRKRIAAAYTRRIADGNKYGAIKALSVEFDTTTTTINTILIEEGAKKKRK